MYLAEIKLISFEKRENAKELTGAISLRSGMTKGELDKIVEALTGAKDSEREHT